MKAITPLVVCLLPHVLIAHLLIAHLLIAQETLPKLTCILEVGVRRSQSAMLEKCVRLVRDKILADNKLVPIELAKLLSFRSEFLPLRLDGRLNLERARLAGGIINFEHGIVTVDSPIGIPIEPALAALGLTPLEGHQDIWRKGTTLVHSFPRDGGGKRLVFGNIFGADPEPNAHLRHQKLPEFNRVLQRVRDRVKGHALWVVANFAPMLAASGAATPVAGFVGPRGLLLAYGIDEIDGRLTLDVHSGIRPGDGLIGQLLPKDAGDAKPIGRPPFEPDFVLAASLGPSMSRRLATLSKLLPGMSWDAKTTNAIQTILEDWTGDATVYVKGDDAVFLFRIDEDAGPDILKAGAKLFLQKNEVAGEIAGRSLLDASYYRGRATNGILALARAPNRERAEAILANALGQGPKPACCRALEAARGHVKVWALASKVKTSPPGVFDLVGIKRVVIAVKWAKTGSHLRLRFETDDTTK